MPNGNEKLRICVGIGEPTHNESTYDDTTRGGANGKGREKSLSTLGSIDPLAKRITNQDFIISHASLFAQSLPHQSHQSTTRLQPKRDRQ